VWALPGQSFTEGAPGRPADFEIEALDRAAPPPPMSVDLLAHRLRAVTTFIRETIQFAPLPGSLPPNLLGPALPWNPRQSGWGTPDNVYSLGLFRLELDEALVITGRSPTCVYFGAQLWNPHMRALDYRYPRGSLNGSEIGFEPDGSFTLVVAHRDPGMPNWLDT